MSDTISSQEGRRASWASLAVTLYRSSQNSKLRGVIRSMVLRAENGPVYSRTIRDIYREFHGVDVGLYSIGPCDVPPGNLAPGTSVGRYSSIYYTVRTITTPDPAKTLSTNRLFSPEALGSKNSGVGWRESIAIGHDVWMGHNVIILPTAQSIGDGAIVGAGSVVHNPVPAYAVVTGNPARVVRFRFPEKVIQELLESKWWLKSIEELKTRLEDFRKPLDGSGVVR